MNYLLSDIPKKYTPVVIQRTLQIAYAPTQTSLLHFTYSHQLQLNTAEQTFAFTDCCTGNCVLSHGTTDASQKLFIYVFLVRYCTTVVMKITYVKQIYVLKILSMFSLIILAGLLKYTTFFHIPYLPFSTCRFQASWDPFDHI